MFLKELRLGQVFRKLNFSSVRRKLLLPFLTYKNVNLLYRHLKITKPLHYPFKNQQEYFREIKVLVPRKRS